MGIRGRGNVSRQGPCPSVQLASATRRGYALEIPTKSRRCLTAGPISDHWLFELTSTIGTLNVAGGRQTFSVHACSFTSVARILPSAPFGSSARTDTVFLIKLGRRIVHFVSGVPRANGQARTRRTPAASTPPDMRPASAMRRRKADSFLRMDADIDDRRKRSRRYAVRARHRT